MKKWSKIWLIVGFVSAVLAYSIYDYLWEGAWYDLTALSFVAYTRVIYLESKGTWSLMAFIIWLTTVNSLIDELFFNPKLIQLNEYVAFALIIIITIKQKEKWMKR